MKKISSYLIQALLLLALVYPALVAAEDEGWKSRWYFGLGLGVSRLNPDSNGTLYDVDDESSEGYKLTLGYDWSERVSIEGYFADIGEAEMSPNGEVEYQDVGISGLYHFYQQEIPHRGFEAFAKAGVGIMENDSDLNYKRVNDAHMMFGLGAGYGFKNGLMLRADLDLFDEDSQFLSINLIKRFGHSRPAPEKMVVVEKVKAEPEYVAPPEPEPIAVAVFTPPSDNDGDGVIDDQDACPETPAGVEVDQQGCTATWDLQGVWFEHDRDILTAKSRKILDQMASRLVTRQTEKRIEIAGYTDAAGSTAYNLLLSQKRATVVFNYLVGKGVDSTLLSTVGRGERQPVAKNRTAEGRAKNRRVELRWK